MLHTYNLILDKKEIGSAADIDVLYNKEDFLITQKDEVSNKINCLISAITVYKAAGGKNLYELSTDNL